MQVSCVLIKMILKVFMDLLENTYVKKLKAIDTCVVPQWVEGETRSGNCQIASVFP